MSVQRDLDIVTETTREIHANLRRNEKGADRRRKAVLRLREAGVTYKRIADAGGLSEVYCYKIIKGPAAVKKQEREAAKRRAARNGSGA